MLATSTREKEAHALKRLFGERSTVSQAKFGKEHGLGTAGMVWQYLNGHRPLNLQAAVKFAKGLGVRIQDFSPRLAAQVRAAVQDVTGTVVQAREPEPHPYVVTAGAHTLDAVSAQEGAVLAQLLRQAPKEERQRILDELRMLVVKGRARLSREDLARSLDVLDRIESAKPGRPRRKTRE